MITSKKHILPPSILFILLPLLIISLSSADRCLHGRTDSYAKKYILYNGSSLDLVLETSSRPSHQITTNIFAIFVKEVLAYSKVRIVEIVDDFNEDDVYRRVGSINDQVPPTMINVEVWVPSHEDPSSYIEQYDIQPVGTLGPSGRFGWFIPMDPVRGLPLFNNRKTELFDVHWTVFRNPETAQLFALDEDVVKKFSEDEDGRYYCDKSTCPEGIYTPPQCRSNTKCALLLAPYFNETGFVIDHIQELNLLAKVIWLGPNLKNVSEMLTDQNKPTIILSWTPNEIILPENNFASVSFPSCSILNTTDTVGCKYELNRMVKVGWSKLKTIAKPIYESLHVFSFLEEEFENLLYRYNNFSHVQTPYDIACNWMNDNFDMIIQRWEPSHDKRVKIFIGGIFPLQGTRGSVSDTATSIVHAARMAKDAINNSTLLRGYELSLVLKDGQCKSDQVMKRFIDYLGLTYYDNLVGVLGPACSETVEPIAGVSKFYNTIVISYSAEGVSFSDRSKYPYFFRTIGENKHYNPVYLELFKKLEWKHVAALAEDGQKYTEYISHLQDLLAANGMSIMNKKFPSEREESAMRTYLEELNNHHTKIIIADLYDEVARAVMCEAYKLNMTAHYGYVWFLPQWLSETWYNTTHYNINNGENINCTMEMMIKAINGHLSLTHAYYAPDNSTMQENITVGEWRRKFETKNNMSLSNYGGYAYDAVWVYANALDQLVKRDPKAISDLHSRNTTDTLVNIIKATDFNGVSGKIKFYGGASRYSVINVVQWYNEKTKIIGSYYPNISANKTDSGRLNLKISDIMWLTPNSQKPDDGSIPPDRCALKEIADLLNVDCSTSILIVNVIGILLLVLIAFIAVFIIMRRYNQKVMLTQKYMRSLGIDVSSKNFNSLNKWEIQRDKVVINRKLGEGAFGTVYGGEAFLEDRGWVGVAVKTLKIGSTIEEKLDFLSEAEIMKRFEHKNIVKLLGVCTQNEPVYTIMEFMLYGDLKTFLLARRHLVSEKNTEDSSEISSRKLTNMALDVARALSYLAENKFVHRDVACRNCLLNAQRLVKLGDFGMTRPMFENDYYKFNRKGMLPVRWMAPESLTLGVFRPSSDVWSYGVLLYEIITFGSFPFQGMTNSQVLEHVKQGNVLNVPIGIKPQLEALMKSCWNIEPKRRPHSSEIVEFLANNPRLLVPCPDLPLASVQLDDRSNEIEMKLPETFRKYSVNPVTKPLLMNNGRLANQNGNCCQVSTSVSDGESIPMDHSWVNEPLLSDNSSEQYRTENELNKYVRFNNKQETDDDYLLSDRFDEPEASSDL